MATIEVRCSKCGSIKVIKHGRTPIGKQRYQCKDCKNSFILDYTSSIYKIDAHPKFHVDTWNFAVFE